MSYQTVVICDECGATRRETNHWFAAWTDPGLGFGAERFDAMEEVRLRAPNVLHFCGQRCLGKRFQAWMGTPDVLNPPDGGCQ